MISTYASQSLIIEAYLVIRIRHHFQILITFFDSNLKFIIDIVSVDLGEYGLCTQVMTHLSHVIPLTQRYNN